MNHQRYLEGKKDEADHPFGTSLSRWDSFAAGHRGALSDKTYVGFSPDAKPCNIGHAKAGTSLDWRDPNLSGGPSTSRSMIRRESSTFGEGWGLHMS